eukprot:gene5128-34934_t
MRVHSTHCLLPSPHPASRSPAPLVDRSQGSSPRTSTRLLAHPSRVRPTSSISSARPAVSRGRQAVSRGHLAVSRGPHACHAEAVATVSPTYSFGLGGREAPSPADVAREEDLTTVMRDFRRASVVRDGVLLVCPITDEWIQPTVELLADTMAEKWGDPQRIDYLRNQMTAYVNTRAADVPQAVLLVALLVTPSGSPEGRDASLSLSLSALAERLGRQGSELDPSCMRAGLVATTELSFSEGTRGTFRSMGFECGATPPEDAPYLVNTAVPMALRGRGYGAAVLRAAEALVLERAKVVDAHTQAQGGENQGGGNPVELFLHLCEQDDAVAGELYRKNGFTTTASERMIVQLIGAATVYLMAKELRAD